MATEHCDTCDTDSITALPGTVEQEITLFMVSPEIIVNESYLEEYRSLLKPENGRYVLVCAAKDILEQFHASAQRQAFLAANPQLVPTWCSEYDFDDKGVLSSQIAVLRNVHCRCDEK